MEEKILAQNVEKIKAAGDDARISIEQNEKNGTGGA